MSSASEEEIAEETGWAALSDSDGEDPEALMEKVKGFIQTANSVLDRLAAFESGPGMKITSPGVKTFRRQVLSEIGQLEALLQGKSRLTEERTKSANIISLEAIMTSLEREKDVTGLCVTLPSRDNGVGAVRIDLICENGLRWVKVKAMNPTSAHEIAVGRGRHGQEGLEKQAQHLLRAAAIYPVNFATPRVVFDFHRGVSTKVASQLEALGIVVEGQRLDMDSRGDWESDEDEGESAEEREGDGSDEETTVAQPAATQLGPVVPIVTNRVNLSVSSLIAYVTEVCYGADEAEYDHPVLQQQAKDEAADHLVPRMNAFMEGKELVVCETAKKEFLKVVDIVGGPRERQRARDVLARARLVPDLMSERASKLKLSARLKERSRIIFGVGDHPTIQAVTMTANAGCVRAASEQGVAFPVFIHAARSLCEAKAIWPVGHPMYVPRDAAAEAAPASDDASKGAIDA